MSTRATRFDGWSADAGNLLLLALGVAAFFPQVTVDGGVFFVQDVMVQNVPFRHFLHEALAAGRLPLWEPAINCGFPLFAEGQVGALYPPNWIGAAVLSPAAAVTASILVHLWLAAAATWLYLRALGCGRAAALTGGIAYGLSGYLVVRAMSPNFIVAAAYLPVLFYLLETGLVRGRPLRIALTGPVLALQLLAGHPQAALYGALAAAAYGIVRAWQLQRPQALLAAALALVGTGVAAVQLLPTYELAQLSMRAGAIDYGQFVNMSLPPERLLCLLLPDFFGNSATGSYWGRSAGFYIQLCPYVGVLTLAFALVGVREGRSSTRGFFGLLAVAGLTLSLGHYTGLFHALHEVPFLRQLRIPTRFLLWWAFAAAVLAGLGVDRLVADRRPPRGTWWPMWLLGVALVAAAGLANASTLWGTPPALGADAGRLLARYRIDLWADLVRAGGALIAVVVLLAPPLRRLRAAPALTGVAAVVLCWTELRDFGAGFNGALPARVYEDSPPAADAIRAHAEGWRAQADPGVPLSGSVRLASLVSERDAPFDWHSGWAYDTSSYEAYPQTLRMYTAGLFGLANTLPGWSPLHLKRHWEFASGLPELLKLANAGFVVSYAPLTSPAVELLHEGTVRVYRNREALPRAYVVPEAVVIADARQRLAALRAGRVDPRRAVILDRPPEAGPEGAGHFAAARITRYEPRRVDVELPGQAGYLVLADTQAPGWVAFVGGERRDVMLANHVFRAVPVDAGEHRLEFRYEPLAFALGGCISVGAAALWLLGVTVARRWKWAASPPERVLALLPAALQAAAIVALYGIARHPELWTAAADRLRLLATLNG